MPRLTKPSFKQKRLVHEFVKHGNAKKAARVAYPDAKEASLSALANATFKNEMVQDYMKKVLEKSGISDEKIASKLNEIIDAGTSKGALKTATTKDAMAAINTALKLKDSFPAEKKQIEQKTAVLNIDLAGKNEKELKDVLDDLIEETRRFKNVIKASTT
jgi:hypothetical protein